VLIICRREKIISSEPEGMGWGMEGVTAITTFVDEFFSLFGSEDAVSVRHDGCPQIFRTTTYVVTTNPCGNGEEILLVLIGMGDQLKFMIPQSSAISINNNEQGIASRFNGADHELGS
jgi:hypothetical protein